MWTNTDTDVHGDAYSDGDTNTNAYGNVNADGYADCDAHLYSKVCSDAAASPYPSTAPVTHNALIRVYDESGDVIQTHEHKGDFKERCRP